MRSISTGRHQRNGIRILSMTERFLYRVFGEKIPHSLKLIGFQLVRAEGKLRE